MTASLKLGEIGQAENRALSTLRNFLFSVIPAKVNLRMIDTYFAYDVTKLTV